MLCYESDLCHDGCARLAGHHRNKISVFLVLFGEMVRGFSPALPLCVCFLYYVSLLSFLFLNLHKSLAYASISAEISAISVRIPFYPLLLTSICTKLKCKKFTSHGLERALGGCCTGCWSWDGREEVAMYEVSAAAVCMFSCLVIQYLLGFLVEYPVHFSASLDVFVGPFLQEYEAASVSCWTCISLARLFLVFVQDLLVELWNNVVIEVCPKIGSVEELCFSFTSCEQRSCVWKLLALGALSCAKMPSSMAVMSARCRNISR